MHVRVCRDCGEEYRPDVVRCADCGGELEDRFGDEGGGAPPEETAAAELAGYRVLFLTPRAADLVPMAERLREARLEYRLAEQSGAEGGPARYALLVPEGDAASALQVLADIVAPHEDKEGIHAVETRFDAEHGYLECPACGARTAGGAAECPECGLGLGGPEGEAEVPRD
jgi:ssDNA-binding Zn-finger/Zn-ribbon topoisomerase 1